MKIQLTFFDEAVEHAKGSKNGRDWEMHSQMADVVIPGERHPSTVKVNLPKKRNGKAMEKGTYEVPVKAYLDNFNGLKFALDLANAVPVVAAARKSA